ncbi:hypothetical protein GCM10010458_23840 [Microbacterium luteolum]
MVFESSPPPSPAEPPNPHEASESVATAAMAAAPNRSDFFMCIAFLTVSVRSGCGARVRTGCGAQSQARSRDSAW